MSRISEDLGVRPGTHAHAVSVLKTDHVVPWRVHATFRASCACGWMGSDGIDDSSLAWREAEEHIGRQLKAPPC